MHSALQSNFEFVNNKWLIFPPCVGMLKVKVINAQKCKKVITNQLHHYFKKFDDVLYRKLNLLKSRQMK